MKDIFGKYKLPITPEERAVIVPVVLKEVTDRVSDKIGIGLVKQIQNSIANSKVNFDHYDLAGLQRDMGNRMALYMIALKSNYPGVKELDNDLSFFFTLEAGDDGCPMLVLSQWLRALVNNEIKVTIDPAVAFPDELLVYQYNEMSDKNSNIRESTELGKLVLEYNAQLSDHTYDGDYDFTEIIMKMLSDEKLTALVAAHKLK